MATGFPQQQVILLIGIVTRDSFTKYKADRTGNNKDLVLCSCCHGNRGLLSNQSKGRLVLSQEAYVLNTKLICFETTKLWMYIFVAMVARFS